MKGVEFLIPMAPQAWQRGGVRWTHAGPRVYTQAKTRQWEQTVAMFAKKAMVGAPPFKGPVDLRLSFLLPIPASWAAWKRAAAARGEIAPTSVPDLDNLEKGVKDALNGIAWRDDAQVVDASKSKRYAAAPSVRVVVTSLPHLLPAQVSRRPEL